MYERMKEFLPDMHSRQWRCGTWYHQGQHELNGEKETNMLKDRDFAWEMSSTRNNPHIMYLRSLKSTQTNIEKKHWCINRMKLKRSTYHYPEEDYQEDRWCTNVWVWTHTWTLIRRLPHESHHYFRPYLFATENGLQFSRVSSYVCTIMLMMMMITLCCCGRKWSVFTKSSR